ncbi:prepilin-type N-terminal cleavage/methylation domain-containing protein [Neomoorella humiferrea]|uniref:type II secretion system protein n=1 Tax=Neomoorella humiferrea TaxID=676965 RepID=UPI003D8F702E
MRFELSILRRDQRGFTLVELLVVIAIIGILAAIIAPNAFRAVEKSKISRTIQDMTALKSAVLAFYADVGFFPADPEPWHQDPGLGVKPDTVTYRADTITAMGLTEQEYRDRLNSRWQGPYLDFSLTQKTAWGGRYDYECWPGQGIFVTIHEIPEASADKLAELSPFEVYYKGQDDVNPSLHKVTLKITDWIY